MVEAAEDTWVLYFFKSLLRVDTSKVQAFWPDMFVVIDWGDDEGKGASSERLPIVISLRGPSTPARGNDAMASTPESDSSAYRLGNPMERKPVSQARVDRSASHNGPFK
jgi:hypothetical protein